MIVRRAGQEDYAAWAAMRRKLLPDENPAELDAELPSLAALDPPYFALVAEDEGQLVGMIELWVRSYAEGGPAGPAAYVEGLWVEPEHRRRGVAKTLLAAAEDWARGQGLVYLGSDALIDNELSHAWHRAVGFDEIERLVIFGRRLD